MTHKQFEEFIVSLPGVWLDYPFGDEVAVYKIGSEKGKMFALMPLDTTETQISLKCDPEKAIALREEYSAIVPAWHFNKKHWNTVYIQPMISRSLLCELIQHSYDLVVAGLPKKMRDEIK